MKGRDDNELQRDGELPPTAFSDATPYRPHDERHAALERIAEQLRGLGLAVPAIEAALLSEARTACQPPLGPEHDDEVRRIASGPGPRERARVTRLQRARDAEIVINRSVEEGDLASAALGAKQLLEAVESDPERPAFGWRPIEEILAEPNDVLEMLWRGVVAKRHFTLVAAAPKTGKTWLLMAWIASVIQRRRWLGLPGPERDVRVLLVTEEPVSVVRRHARRFGIERLMDVLTIDAMPVEAGWNEIVRVAVARAQERKAEILIFDTVSTLAGMEDENAAADVNRALRPLSYAARQNDLAVAAVHHLGANGRIRGSTVFEAIPDVLLEVRRVKGSPRSRALVARGRLEDVPEAPVVVEYVDPGLHGEPATFRVVSGLHEDAELEAKRRAAEAKERLEYGILCSLAAEARWLGRAEIAERTAGFAVAAVKNHLPSMADAGLIGRRRREGRGGGFEYAGLGVEPVCDAELVCDPSKRVPRTTRRTRRKSSGKAPSSEECR